MDREQRSNETQLHTGESEVLGSQARRNTERKVDEAKIQEFQEMKGNGRDAGVTGQLPSSMDKGDLAEQERQDLEHEYQAQNKQYQEQSVEITQQFFNEQAQQEAKELHTAETTPQHELKP